MISDDFYFLFPNRPLTIEVAPLLITALSAFVAARFPMVAALVFLPPRTEFTRLVLTDLATEEVALFAACSMYFVLAFLAFSASLAAAAAAFSASFWALASSFAAASSCCSTAPSRSIPAIPMAAASS